MRKFGVAPAMRPHTTLRHLLVHPQDKVELAEQGDLVYQIPCKNCGIGDTGRLQKHTIGRTQEGRRQHEQCEIHKEREKRLTSHFNKSAITDHATTENQIIIWEGAKIIDKEPNKRIQQVKEAIWTRKTQTPMNRDEGNYELPHVYDDVFRYKY